MHNETEEAGAGSNEQAGTGHDRNDEHGTQQKVDDARFDRVGIVGRRVTVGKREEGHELCEHMGV